MYELTQATNISTPPAGYHSVKGIGVTEPNAQENYKLPDGAEIPLGKPVNQNNNHVVNANINPNFNVFNQGMNVNQPVNAINNPGINAFNNQPVNAINNQPVNAINNQVYAIRGAAAVAGPSLLYNEYIVYNEEQVNLKYLVKFSLK
jgi:hypothetical protein